jgi:hypothetical protein
LAQARVKEQPAAGGLALVSKGAHLIRAAVWAAVMAHRPSPVPAIR